jgi:hypothetical protein
MMRRYQDQMMSYVDSHGQQNGLSTRPQQKIKVKTARSKKKVDLNITRESGGVVTKSLHPPISQIQNALRQSLN